MTDTTHTGLRARIKALAGMHWQGKRFVDEDAVLALLDTPTAPQETAGEAVAWVCAADMDVMRRKDGDEISVSPRIRPELGMKMPLYDHAAPAAATTDDTALTEALRPFVRLIEVSALRSCAEDSPIFTQGSDDDRRSITVGDFLRAETALASRPADATSRERVEAAHRKALELSVCLIAFVGRDRGTARMDKTLDGLVQMARETDAALRETIPPKARDAGEDV